MVNMTANTTFGHLHPAALVRHLMKLVEATPQESSFQEAPRTQKAHPRNATSKTDFLAEQGHTCIGPPTRNLKGHLEEIVPGGMPRASPMPDQILKMDFVEEFFIGFDPHPTPATAHRPPSSSPGVFDNQKSHRYNTGSGKTATDATEARNPPRIERVPRTAPHGGLHDWPRHTS